MVGCAGAETRSLGIEDQVEDTDGAHCMAEERMIQYRELRGMEHRKGFQAENDKREGRGFAELELRMRQESADIDDGALNQTLYRNSQVSTHEKLSV